MALTSAHLFSLRVRRAVGFSLTEVMVVVAIIGIISALAVPNLSSWVAGLRVKDAARSIAGLLEIARTEAGRTGDNHLVFFGMDAQGNPLPAVNPADPAVRYAGVAVRDSNQNGQIDGGEVVAGVPPVTDVFWGISSAAVPAPSDPDSLGSFAPGFPGFTFQNAGGAPAQWIAFHPDGVPVAFSAVPYSEAAIGSAGGAVYVNSPGRDYAAVLRPLGGVRVHAWDSAQGQWR